MLCSVAKILKECHSHEKGTVCGDGKVKCRDSIHGSKHHSLTNMCGFYVLMQKSDSGYPGEV